MRDIDPDAQGMLAFASGDMAAFDKLFERWKAPLLRYLDRIVRNPAAAEELVQETFLRVYRARDRYVAEAKFSTWLFRIATNLAFNELRRPATKQRHTSTDEFQGHEELSSSEPSPERVAEARILGKAVEAEFAQLPERQRMALWLCAVQGLSYLEIADVLDTTPQSVKALVHRARVRLADGLAGSATEGGDTG